MNDSVDSSLPDSSPTRRLIWLLAAAILAAVGLFLVRNLATTPEGPNYPSSPEGISQATQWPISDKESVAQADISLLFVGNSHTTFHNLHELVGDLIRFRAPDKRVYTQAIGDTDLERAQNNPVVTSEINARTWNAVVLQGQSVSQSGKYLYSKKGALALGKQARAKGLRVLFYSEWGLRGVLGNSEHTEKIYNELAMETESELIPVGRVWARALESSPELNLFELDGNHQNRLGASLTALVIASTILKEPAHVFLEFRDPVASLQNGKFSAKPLNLFP